MSTTAWDGLLDALEQEITTIEASLAARPTRVLLEPFQPPADLPQLPDGLRPRAEALHARMTAAIDVLETRHDEEAGAPGFAVSLVSSATPSLFVDVRA